MLTFEKSLKKVIAQISYHELVLLIFYVLELYYLLVVLL